jgi:predicted hydrocarbon binding protein
MMTAPEFHYPNRMGRIILLAMEEVLGRVGVNAVLNLAHLSGYIGKFPPDTPDLSIPFAHISALQEGLEHAYGPRAGRGLALRVGRACFKYGLREFGSELGLADVAFRLLPLSARLQKGSLAFAALFNNFTDQHVRLESDAHNIYWHIERCPLCWGRHTDGPVCSLAVGLIQEALYWVSGGKYFQVEEKTCIACGDSACTIVIDQTPMS